MKAKHQGKEVELPNPGSATAIVYGCLCPVIDNHHGNGYGGDHNKFAVNYFCPLHGAASGDGVAEYLRNKKEP